MVSEYLIIMSKHRVKVDSKTQI